MYVMFFFLFYTSKFNTWPTSICQTFKKFKAISDLLRGNYILVNRMDYA